MFSRLKNLYLWDKMIIFQLNVVYVVALSKDHASKKIKNPSIKISNN